MRTLTGSGHQRLSLYPLHSAKSTVYGHSSDFFRIVPVAFWCFRRYTGNRFLQGMRGTFMAEFTAKGANILLDDDDDIREIVHILLARRASPCGKPPMPSAGALRRLDLLPDLVILDVMMLGLSGIELCREIRTKAMMPILFLSAKTRDVDKAEGFASGGDDYLIKRSRRWSFTSRASRRCCGAVWCTSRKRRQHCPRPAKRRVVHRPSPPARRWRQPG